MNIDQKISEKIPLFCLLKLQAVYDSLKTAERKAADFLLENPDFLADATITEAARRAGCSEPTFVRLSRKMGLDGFAELKVELTRMKYMKQSPDREFSKFSFDDSLMDITKKVFNSSVQALHDTLMIVDEKQYERAVNALIGANKIVFFGVGDAHSVALSAMYKFTRIGYPCSATSDADHMLILASQLGPNDVAVLISHSGRSKTIVEAAKHLRRAGRTAIAITNFPISPLTKEAEIVLLTSAFQEHVNGEVMAVRIVQLIVIESLYTCTLFKNPNCIERMVKSNDVVALNKLY
jgi:RpiR family carbohydrate utilization transcriptional regulator